MDSTIIERKKRPILVWVISIFYIFSAGYTLLSFYLIYTGGIVLQPEQKVYFDSLTFIDIGTSVLVVLSNLIGAVMLFNMRKKAVYFFVLSLIVNLVMILWYVFAKGLIESVGIWGLVGALGGWLTLGAVCVYAKMLEKSGVLK
ncbi:MAG: hypothetical protein KKE11_03400 [Gammaproteobacteria bacterium]|nr:hypothetical protein [Gammaproteobacteria bacterium]